MTPAIAENAQSLVRLWKFKVEKTQVHGASCFSCEGDFRYATLDAIMLVITGKSAFAVEDAISQLSSQTPVVDKFGGAQFHVKNLPISDAIAYLFGSISDVINMPPTFRWLYANCLRWTPTFRRHHKVATDTMNRSIVNHRQLSREARTLGETIESDCLIGMIIRNEDQPDQEVFPDEEIRDSGLTFMLVKYLTDAPDVQRTLRGELLRELGDDAHSRSLTYEDIKSPEKVPYLEAVIAEILRLSMIGGGSARTTSEPIEYLGYTIPAGVNLIHFSAMSCFDATTENEAAIRALDPKRTETSRKSGQGGRKLWSTPTDQFNPDRWIKEDPVTKQRTFDPKAGFSFPFGLGLRSCSGRQVAVLELKIYVATLNLSFFLDHVPKELSSHRAVIKLSRAPTQEAPTFDLIDELQQHGINVQDIQKLKSASIHTVQGVKGMSRRNMCKIKKQKLIRLRLHYGDTVSTWVTNVHLSVVKHDPGMQEAAVKILGSSFLPATLVLANRKGVFWISTGSKAVDAVLGGGVQSRCISEVYGEYRTGKTQLAHTLCVVTQLPKDMGGASGKVAYIDTEGTFRPERIAQIADRFNLESGPVLENIVHARALNSEHQMELTKDLGERLAEGGYRLIIVDSIMALFRVDYSGRGELSERQQKLAQFLAQLTRMAEEYNTGRHAYASSRHLDLNHVPSKAHLGSSSSSTKTKTMSTNLKALKNDLKAWKNAFVQEHGREPTKDDVKANPQIAAKHKLWKEMEKESKQKEDRATHAITSDPPTTPLPVRRSKPKQSNSNAQFHASIFQHAKATETRTDGATLAAAASSNPFSPTKRRLASEVPRPRLSLGDDPFVASPSSSSTTAAEPLNPFAPSVSSPLKQSRHTSLFTTPAKSRSRVSETSVAPSLAEMLMSGGEARSNTRGEMRHSTSPKKMKQLISTARDTPRTKARKRMRGEEVDQTPGDKRRRINKPPSPIPQEMDEAMDDEDEVMDLSPVKPPPLKSGKGKAFQPVLDDDLEPSQSKPIKAPQGLFFSGPSRLSSNPTSSLLSAKGASISKTEPRSRRSTSVSVTTDSSRTTPDPLSDTPVEGAAIPAPFINKRQGKRTRAETEDSESSRSSLPPESTITSQRDEPPLPPGMANPFGLRPPSPFLEQGSQNKGKGKWGERKKGKMDAAVMRDEDEAGEDDSTEDIKEVDWHARTGFRRTTSGTQKEHTDKVPFEDDSVNRLRITASQRPREGTPPVDGTETLQVDLPDEMKRVLHIESPSKRRTEETIVQGLLSGELAPEKLKKQDIWGAGEFEEPEDDEENDWDSDPEGWKGVVEISIFFNGVSGGLKPSKDPDVFRDLKLLCRDQPEIAHNAFKALVNLSDSALVTPFLSDPSFLEFLVSYTIHPPSVCGELAGMILSNLTAHVAPCNSIIDMKIPVIVDSSIHGGFYPTSSRCATSPTPTLPQNQTSKQVAALPLLLDAFVQAASEDSKRKAKLHFLASVFANLTADAENLPPSLQLLPNTKKREVDPVLRHTLLEGLVLLCTTRWGRQQLRDNGAYIIIREAHKMDKDEKVLEIIERLVNLLQRDEGPIEPGEDLDGTGAPSITEVLDEEDDAIVEV
ncbi:Meiotic recombination protein dmc1 [Tulasnella sp. 427]|nr:Meiotic recombination protein dmc1 [Tulasnella sp. 427]